MSAKNEVKHTPGPWEAWQDSLGHWYIKAPRSSRHDVIVSPVLPVPVEGFAKANAHLIAAAPDLLKALKTLLDAVKNNPTMNKREFVDMGIMVNNAIAKAEGGER